MLVLMEPDGPDFDKEPSKVNIPSNLKHNSVTTALLSKMGRSKLLVSILSYSVPTHCVGFLLFTIGMSTPI